MIAPIWTLPERQPEADRALAEALGTSPILAALLRNRGLEDPGEARRWLLPRLQDLEPPEAIIDMAPAAERLARAIRERERVVVYGDYDVDGMSGTAVLLNFIRLAGGDGGHYIPNRLKEGYSFNDEAIESLLQSERPPKLVVTVDHGISALEGIARLADAGVDVVITDHHEPPAELSDRAVAMVNPHRKECTGRSRGLCGAGVGFKLAWATAQCLSEAQRVSDEFKAYLVEAMGLVALATVTDVVPLKGENRILTHHGLKALPATKHPGIAALLSRARLTGKPLKASHLGFRIGPRLNAAGRMGKAERALELLTTDDSGRAAALAEELDDLNDARRAIEKDILEACLQSAELKDFDGSHALCLGARGWHVGVIGIVASRLVDRYGVPVLIAGLHGEAGRCSARSPKGFHLKEFLDELSEHLVSHGGHAQAAGATVTEAAWPAFQAAFIARSKERLAAEPLRTELHLDLELPFTAIGPHLVQEIDRMAPHGASNPPPLFLARNVAVAGSVRTMGRDGSHLAFHGRHRDRTYRVVAFGQAEHAPMLRKPGAAVDLAYKVKFDTFGDPGAVEIEAVSIRPATAADDA